MNGFFERNTARLAYSVRGAGLPVVFLHPTPVDGEYWGPLTEELAGIQAIVPDLRGHGRSELGTNLPVGIFAAVPDAPVLTMAELATDTVALLDHLEIDKAVIVGCSIGGSILFQTWRQAPERVLGLAIVCAKPQPDSEAGRANRVRTIARARAGEIPAIFDGMAESLVGATARARQPNVVPAMRARMTLGVEALTAVQAGLALRPDSVPTVATIDVPLLAIRGGEDPGVTAEEFHVMSEAPGGCELHTLPDAGHFAAFEQPERVARWMATWLQAQGE